MVWSKSKHSVFWNDRLNVAIGLGLCCLPFVFAVAAFLFDFRTAWFAVIVAFLVILVICNALCRFPPKNSKSRNG